MVTSCCLTSSVNSLPDDAGGSTPSATRTSRSSPGDSTWFRNAYTIYDSTERAQPAIFDGNLPSEDKLPTSADHPKSIFTLFAKTHR